MRLIMVGLLLASSSMAVQAENYGGFGIGYSEACRTKYQASFFGGDCIQPNVALHGLIGHEISDYFAVEASLDTSFSAGHIVDAALESLLSFGEDDAFNTDNTYRKTTTNRWTVATLGVSAFLQLPVGDQVSFFVGPSVGGSFTNFDYDVDYFGDPNSDSDYGSESEFGLNYGGAFGVNIRTGRESGLRLQWQNWRSLDANTPTNGEFNSNTFTVNFMSYFD